MFIEYEHSPIANGCPMLLIGPRGSLARINPDLSWSVNWPEVIHQAYEPKTPNTTALIGICELLVAGRDNFRTTPWSDPLVPWTGPQYTIGKPGTDFNNEKTLFVLSGCYNELVALLHASGEWSVNWDAARQVLQYSQELESDDRDKILTIIGFCEMLLGAKDNFHAKRFDFSNQEE